mgnify:CR=1 FL=1
MILADKIINERKKLGWSQEELAEKLDVSRQSVSKWESAQSAPDLNRVLKMAEIFGVSTDYLLKDEVENQEPKYTADEPTTETYGGDEYACLNVTTDQGYSQKMLMKKENGYMVMITLTYFPELESDMQSFLDSFTEVN